jgi:hypothetical protein
MQRISTFVALTALAVLMAACSRPPLTKDAARDLIQDSPEFQSGQVKVTLTPDEIKKGADAGYWNVVEMNKTNSQLPSSQIIALTPVGKQHFQGTVSVFMPVLSIQQPMGTRVVEVQDVQDSPQDPREKIVTFTWIRRFDSMVPELVELFKDQPPQNGKKTFRYGKSGWEIKP